MICWKTVWNFNDFFSFENFRLVGGTALSLQLGHRISVDIDLFSDDSYGSIDFEEIENFLKSNFFLCRWIFQIFNLQWENPTL